MLKQEWGSKCKYHTRNIRDDYKDGYADLLLLPLKHRANGRINGVELSKSFSANMLLRKLLLCSLLGGSGYL